MQSTLDFLKGICSDVKIVQGDFDDFESPEQLVSSGIKGHAATQAVGSLGTCT